MFFSPLVLLIQQRYNFESNSQLVNTYSSVNDGVAYTAKIQFRKQFTTVFADVIGNVRVLLIQQRYNFESNSQLCILRSHRESGCCLYSKDTISKAIHNLLSSYPSEILGVAYTAKIQFRKQFTTQGMIITCPNTVLLIQQRYNFESNSQQLENAAQESMRCCLYSKDTISKAIHNRRISEKRFYEVLLIQQRYNFESNSQPVSLRTFALRWCCLYSKDTISKAIHNRKS